MKSGERKYTKSSLPFSWLTWVIFSALVIVSPSLIAQECQCTNCPLTLPDVQSTAFIGYLQVEGATLNTLGGNNCVESVCIEISHDFIGDLAIFLTAPDGTTVVLFADGNGGIGFPYGNTGVNMNVCFTLPGASTNGSFAGAGGGNCTNPAYFMPCNGPTPCYSGTWEPWGQTCGAGGLNLFNNGTGTVNGVWTLTVYDNALVNQGVLENFEIQFCENDGITVCPVWSNEAFAAGAEACKSDATFSVDFSASYCT
jgi:subtilisin-like proprotein convertase family protein